MLNNNSIQMLSIIILFIHDYYINNYKWTKISYTYNELIQMQVRVKWCTNILLFFLANTFLYQRIILNKSLSID